MKRIELMLAIGTIAMIALSCARGYVDPSQKPVGGTKTVTLTVNADELSRVGHIDGTEGVDVVWRAGDQVLVVDAANSANTAVFTLQSGENTSLGVFSGTVPETTGTLNVYYPADINTAPISYLLQTQVGDNSMSHFADADLMSATGVVITEANTAQVTMVHHGIIFTIPIVNNTAAEQHIVGVTIADQKGFGEINFAGRVSLVENALTDVKAASIDLVFAQTLTAGAEGTANVVAYLSDYSALSGKSIDIFVHTEAGRYRTTKTGIAMAAGTRYTIEGVTMGAENFESNLALVGNSFESGGNYVVDDRLAVTNNNDGTYTWSGPLFEGAFRFSNVTDSEWADETFAIYDGTDAIAVNAHSTDNIVPQFVVSREGLYDVAVDFNTMQATVDKTADHRFIYPVGNATPYGWEPTASQYLTGYEVDGDDEIVSGRMILSVDPNAAANASFIKFIRRKTFSVNTVEHIIPSGGSKVITPNTTETFTQVANPSDVGQDYNWIVNDATAGEYTIVINYTQRTIRFDREIPDGISLPAYRNGTF